MTSKKGNLMIFLDDSSENSDDDDDKNIDDSPTTENNSTFENTSDALDSVINTEIEANENQEFTLEASHPVLSNNTENQHQDTCKLTIDKKGRLEFLQAAKFDEALEKCSVSFEGNSVTLRGSESCIAKAKIQLYEKLNQIEPHMVPISETLAGILQRQKGSDYLKKKASELSFPCVFEVHKEDKQYSVMVIAETEDLQSAVKFIDDEFEVLQISCKDIRMNCFSSKVWIDLLDCLTKNYLVNIQYDSSQLHVIVEGHKFDLGEVSDQIKAFLKNNKGPVNIHISRGKGHCLQNSEALQKEIEKLKDISGSSGGEFCLILSAGGCKITASGLDDTEVQVQQLLAKIYHGKVDLSRISTNNESDIGLLCKCLTSKIGDSFIKDFEKDHGVGIDISQTTQKIGIKHSDSMPVIYGKKRRHLQVTRAQSLPCLDTIDSDSDSEPAELQHRTNEPVVIQVQSVTLSLTKGGIAQANATMLVNVMSKSSLWNYCKVAKSFLKAAGPKNSLLEDFKVENEKDDTETVVITRSSGNLKRQCDYICSIILQRWNGDQSVTVLREALRKVYQFCEDNSVESIAMPAVGTGLILKFPHDKMAKCMIKEALRASQSSTSLKTIKFVIYDDKEFYAMKAQLPAQHVQRKKHVGFSPRHRRRSGERWQGKEERRHTKKEEDCFSTQKHVVSEEESVDMVDLTVYADSMEKTKECQALLSQKIESEFLVQEKIQVAQEYQRSRDFCKRICKKTEGQNVVLIFGPEIIVKGFMTHVVYVANEIRKILLEVNHSGHPQHSSERSKAKRWTGPKHKRKSKEFWTEVEEYQTPPLYWKRFRGGYRIEDLFRYHRKDIKCFISEVDQITFSAIENLVESTWNSSIVGKGSDAKNLTHSAIKISKIERVENLELIQNYIFARCKLIRKLKGNDNKEFLSLENDKACQKGAIQTTSNIDKLLTTDMYPEINEHYLFHGTKLEYVANIAEKGIDPKRTKKAMFGEGVYAAESSTKADQYTDNLQNRQNTGLKMILARILLGEMFVTSTPNAYKNPPCMTCHQDCTNSEHKMYDSIVVDGQWLFREFIVYNALQSYPEYIITYDRV